jgi:hypothetical protein
MPSEEEVMSLSPVALRFREACHFLGLFRETCGPQVPLGRRFLWVTNADAFLMAIASIRDVSCGTYRHALMQHDLFRFVQVMRNLTTHHFVVTSPGESFINRNINLSVATGFFFVATSAEASNPQPAPPLVETVNWEEPQLVQETVLRRLEQYETDLQPGSRLHRLERLNIDAARRWTQANLAAPVKLLDVFTEVLREVASVCGFQAQATQDQS